MIYSIPFQIDSISIAKLATIGTMGEEGLASLLGLVRGTNKMDAPVPACLNHCINQEVFSCKVRKWDLDAIASELIRIPITHIKTMTR